jgi:hypothetical protein
MNDYCHSLFSYWSDGDHRHELHPDPPSKEEAKPFHVVAHNEVWIPISVLVFARDEDHARDRVENALQQMSERDYDQKWPHPVSTKGSRAARILDDIRAGHLDVLVEPYDTDLLCAAINWSSNGGI